MSKFWPDSNGQSQLSIRPFNAGSGATQTPQVIAVSSTHAESAALKGSTTIIRIVATTNSWVSIGPSVTAAAHTAGSIYLPAGVVEYWSVDPTWIVSVVRDSADGYLSLTEAA